MNVPVRSITTLIFDWDGTLADSARRGFTAFQKSFAELGVAFSRAVFDATYSPNWYTMYEALGLARERWQMADELWLRHYGEEQVTLIDGAGEVISRLQEKGYRLGVVSSGSQRRIAREISETGLAFDVVVCNEDVVNKKPHPEGLEKAMRALDCRGESSCYIGDTPEDILMGKRARVMTVGVRSDYPSSRNLRAARPDLYLEAISELAEYF